MTGVRQYSTLFRKEGAEHSYDCLDFNIACIDSKIIVRTEGKPLYSENHNGADGERLFVPSSRKIQGADIDFVFCLRGEYTTANTNIYAFIKYLIGADGSGVWFDFYDVYSHVARKHCYIKSISEDAHFRNEAGDGYTTFKMVIRATKNEQDGLLSDFSDTLADYDKEDITPSSPSGDMLFTRISPMLNMRLSDLGMVLIDSHILGSLTSKEIANTDWDDEDGDDSFAGERIFLEPYDIEYRIGYKGSEFSAAENVRDFFDSLSGHGLFLMSDMASGVTYRGVNAVSYEEERSHRELTKGNLDDVEGFSVLITSEGNEYEDFITSDEEYFTPFLKRDGDIVVFKMRFRVTSPTL